MKIDRRKFLQLAAVMAAPACGGGTSTVRSDNQEVTHGVGGGTHSSNVTINTNVHTNAAGYGATDECIEWDPTGECVRWDSPIDECTNWDPTGECIQWLESDQQQAPTYECIDWDPTGECIQWLEDDHQQAPTYECVDWDPTGECIQWQPGAVRAIR